MTATTLTINLDYGDPQKLRAYARMLNEVADLRQVEIDNMPVLGSMESFGPGDALPDKGPNYAAMKAAADEAEAPKKRGRRTKAEIEAEKAAAEAPPPATRDAREADALANISTGEERIDPATEAEQAQDAADEAAEAEVVVAVKQDLTHDDVRAALKAYMDFYGQAATMEDGPKVFKMLFGDKAAKVSDIPNDQASLHKAIDGVNEMRVKNPFNREPNL